MYVGLHSHEYFIYIPKSPTLQTTNHQLSSPLRAPELAVYTKTFLVNTYWNTSCILRFSFSKITMKSPFNWPARCSCMSVGRLSRRRRFRSRGVAHVLGPGSRTLRSSATHPKLFFWFCQSLWPRSLSRDGWPKSLQALQIVMLV